MKSTEAVHHQFIKLEMIMMTIILMIMMAVIIIKTRSCISQHIKIINSENQKGTYA